MFNNGWGIVVVMAFSIIFFNLGTLNGYKSIAVDCNRLGAFGLSKAVYTCQRSEANHD